MFFRSIFLSYHWMLLNFTPCTLNVSLSGSWTNQRWPCNVNGAIALIQAYPDIHVHQTGFQLHLWSFWGHSDPKTQLVFSVGVSQSDSRSHKGWRWSSVWDKYDTYLWINPLWNTLKKQTNKNTWEEHHHIHLSICHLPAEKEEQSIMSKWAWRSNREAHHVSLPCVLRDIGTGSNLLTGNQTICSLLLFLTSLSASLGCHSVSLHEKPPTNSVIRTQF